MTTAIILFNCKRSKVKEAQGKIKNIDGIVEIHTVAGEYDFVAIFKTDNPAHLSDVLTNQIVNIEEISRTKTLLSLEEYTK